MNSGICLRFSTTLQGHLSQVLPSSMLIVLRLSIQSSMLEKSPTIKSLLDKISHSRSNIKVPLSISCCQLNLFKPNPNKQELTSDQSVNQKPPKTTHNIRIRSLSNPSLKGQKIQKYLMKSNTWESLLIQKQPI